MTLEPNGSPSTPRELIGSDGVRLLSEVGFLALSKGMPEEARRIFDGIAAVRDGEEVAVIGRGLAALASGEPETAVEILRSGSMSDVTSVFLAIALAKAGETGAAKAQLDDVAEMSNDPAIARVAREAVAEI